MEPKGSLPYLQQPASGLNPDPDDFSLYAYTVSLRYILILSQHLHLGFPVVETQRL
jgi:hypothetical protein